MRKPPIRRTLKCSKSGKTVHADESAAEDALKQAWESRKWTNRHGRMPRKVYLCPHCGFWHLGSGPEY